MNATELYTKEARPTGVFFCEKCNRVGLDKASAERCCVPHRCKTCGKEEKMLECNECFTKREREKEAQRFEKAEKVSEWEGWVYSDGLGYKNGYFESVEDLEDYLEDQPSYSRPEYVWTCEQQSFVSADAETIYEQIENDERAYEDFERGSLNGTDELEAALKAFTEANTGIVSYTPDYSKALLLPERPATDETQSNEASQ